MAFDFSGKTWAEEIGEITELEEYQTCSVRIMDFSNAEQVYDYDTDEMISVGEVEVYVGRARFIPVRASVYQGGEAQLNTTSIRAVRFQLPMSERDKWFKKGMIVTFTAAKGNPSLLGRSATVTDDFLGSSAASRTFNAMMDADSEEV